MHRPAPRLTAVLLAGIALLAFACAQTKLTDVWESQEQFDQYQKLMVLALSDDIETRRTFEYEFAVQLERADIDAVPSLELLSPSDKPVKTVIQPKLESQGIDAVLAVRLKGTTDSDPRRLHREDLGFYGYYSRYHGVEGADATTLSLESSLYDAGSALLVWQATSETFDPVGVKFIARTVADTIIKDLQQRGLVR